MVKIITFRVSPKDGLLYEFLVERTDGQTRSRLIRKVLSIYFKKFCEERGYPGKHREKGITHEKDNTQTSSSIDDFIF